MSSCPKQGISTIIHLPLPPLKWLRLIGSHLLFVLGQHAATSTLQLPTKKDSNFEEGKINIFRNLDNPLEMLCVVFTKASIAHCSPEVKTEEEKQVSIISCLLYYLIVYYLTAPLVWGL
jgi:hypothetical protein